MVRERGWPMRSTLRDFQGKLSLNSHELLQAMENYELHVKDSNCSYFVRQTMALALASMEQVHENMCPTCKKEEE